MSSAPLTLLAASVGAFAADEPLPEVLRALENVGGAEGARPSEDNRQLAFVTTLFGSRQAATMPLDGGYPVQLTAEPGGVVAVRWSPSDPHLVVAVALRDGKRRLLMLDDQGTRPVELDPAPGDQLLGGFTRDGKKLFYGVVEGGALSLRQVGMDAARKVTEVKPGAIAPQSPFPAAATSPSRPATTVPAPPTMRGAAPAPAAAAPPQAPAPARQAPLALEEALQGLAAVGPVSPDGRSLLAQTRRAGDESVWTVDLAGARAEPLTPHEGTARFRLPRWSPDGRTVYVLTDAGREALGVDAVTVSSRERRTIYAPGRTVEGFALTDDGHRLAVAEEANGQTVFSVLELPGLRAQPAPRSRAQCAGARGLAARRPAGRDGADGLDVEAPRAPAPTGGAAGARGGGPRPSGARSGRGGAVRLRNRGNRPQSARSAAASRPRRCARGGAARLAPLVARARRPRCAQAAPGRGRRRLGGGRAAARARAGRVRRRGCHRPGNQGGGRARPHLVLAHRPAPAGPLRPRTPEVTLVADPRSP